MKRAVIGLTLAVLTFSNSMAGAQNGHQKLEESMGWLIGKRWEGTGEAQGEFPVSKFTTQERFRWIVDKQCIEQRWVMKDGDGQTLMSGLIIYGWDAEEGRLKSWGFSDKGDVSGSVLESCDDGKLVWKGCNTPLKEGIAGDFTYVQKYADGRYAIEFAGRSLTAKQALEAVPGAAFSFKSAPDSKPNEQIKDWARYLVGGTWATTMQGERVEHAYRWILNKNFLYNTRTGGPNPGLAIFGYDPTTDKLTLWHFENDGMIGRSTIAKETDAIWKLEGGGHGPKGKYVWTSKLVREEKDRLREKEVKISIGEKQLPETEDMWIKEPAKKK